MAVNKLPEFAKNGQKNTDGLTLEDGFPVNLKPARQWFNFLFNNLTLAINQIIDDKLNKDANAVSATKLKDARKINTVDFDGTKDINISAPMRELIATNLNKALDDGFYTCSGVDILGLYSYGILEVRRSINGVIQQTYYAHLGDAFRVAVRQSWDSGQSFSEWMIVGLRANTASRLENPRTVSFSGGATGSFNYDGTGNSSCILTLSNSGVVAGTYASTVQIPSITVNEKGLITGVSQQTIRSASVTQTGIVQLADDLISNDSSKALTAKQGKVLNENKVEVGKSFSDAFAKDVDFYQDNQTEQFFRSFNDFPLGSRVLVAKNTNLLNTPNIADDFIYVETKTTFKNSAPGRHQIAIGYSNGEIAVRSAPTNANYSQWKYTANTNSNVASSSKLQNIRKIFGQDFDGTSDVAGNITTSTGILLADLNHFIDTGRAGLDRMNFNVYHGVFNFINSENGNIVARLNSNGIDCNAATASKFQNPRKINGVAFDGTTDINIAAPLQYLGELRTTEAINSAITTGFYTVSGLSVAGLYSYGVLEVRAQGYVVQQTYYAHAGDFRVASRQSWDGGGNYNPWSIVGYSSATASKLQNSRRITFTGAATGTFTFDGSKDEVCELSSSDLDVLLYSPIPYSKQIPPDGYMMVMGQALLQEKHPKLFERYGSRLPDQRAQSIRGWDNGRGIDVGRVLLSEQSDEIKEHAHPTNINAYVPTGKQGGVAGSFIVADTIAEYNRSTLSTGGSETRVKNIAYNYIVKIG